MSLILGIAKGALAIGKKLVTKIKANKEAKVLKKADQLVRAQEAAANVGALTGNGLISGAGNIVSNLKGLVSDTGNSNNSPAPQDQSKMALYIGGGLAVLFLLMKMMKKR